MGSHVVSISGAAIRDWATFHDVFAAALGFPGFYGRNIDAWIDCLTCADDAEAGMVAEPVPAGAVLTIQIDNVHEFAAECPDEYCALVECAAFVNWRRLERGDGPVLALSFHHLRTGEG